MRSLLKIRLIQDRLFICVCCKEIRHYEEGADVGLNSRSVGQGDPKVDAYLRMCCDHCWPSRQDGKNLPADWEAELKRFQDEENADRIAGEAAIEFVSKQLANCPTDASPSREFMTNTYTALFYMQSANMDGLIGATLKEFVRLLQENKSRYVRTACICALTATVGMRTRERKALYDATHASYGDDEEADNTLEGLE